MVLPLPTTPILTRQMFQLPTPVPVPTFMPAPVPASSTSAFQPCCSTRSKLGQPPEVLDPSNHFVTEYLSATDYLSAPANTSPTEHYCNMFGIKLPSGKYGCTTSQGGS